MSEQDLTLSNQMQQVLAELIAVRTELNSLKQRAAALPRIEPTISTPSTKVSNTRRKTLKRLGLALLGGAAAATISGFSVSEAKMVVSPAGENGQVGVVIVPPSKPVPTGYPVSGVYMGLVSTDGVDLNLSGLPDLIKDYSWLSNVTIPL